MANRRIEAKAAGSELDDRHVKQAIDYAANAGVEWVALRDKQDATSRYTLAALILNNESVIGVIRRELRRVVDVLVDEKQISFVEERRTLRALTAGPRVDEVQQHAALLRTR